MPDEIYSPQDPIWNANHYQTCMHTTAVNGPIHGHARQGQGIPAHEGHYPGRQIPLPPVPAQSGQQNSNLPPGPGHSSPSSTGGSSRSSNHSASSKSSQKPTISISILPGKTQISVRIPKNTSSPMISVASASNDAGVSPPPSPPPNSGGHPQPRTGRVGDPDITGLGLYTVPRSPAVPPNPAAVRRQSIPHPPNDIRPTRRRAYQDENTAPNQRIQHATVKPPTRKDARHPTFQGVSNTNPPGPAIDAPVITASVEARNEYWCTREAAKLFWRGHDLDAADAKRGRATEESRAEREKLERDKEAFLRNIRLTYSHTPSTR